jgi:hypothetical protein
MEIGQREDELFRGWRHSRKYDSFVIDGAPCPSAFLSSRVRTVIILKDINAPDVHGDFDLRRQLATDPDRWWRTVANWCAAMSPLCSSKPIPWSNLNQLSIKECLEPFAFIQLKKTAGGGSVSMDTLREYARSDAEKIQEQLRIYQPEVIVCCGVGDILKTDVLNGAPWEQTDRGIRYSKLTLFDNPPTFLIDYMHPSVRAWKSVVCYGLLDAYRDVVGRHNLGTARTIK